MNIKENIDKIRAFIGKLDQNAVIYHVKDNPQKFFKKSKIKVELDSCKDIILQDETKCELGGVKKESFSLIYPLHLVDFIKDGTITLIGPEFDKNSSSIDFGLFILIGFEKKIDQKEYGDLKYFNFISNGIDGFLIRTVPRKFWCRISKEIADKFSFEFFGNAINYLYRQKFGALIKSLEIIFINSREQIKQFVELTSEIRDDLNLKWKEKIEEWKKRLDCEYDWECVECPYEETCEEVKDVLDERNHMH